MTNTGSPTYRLSTPPRPLDPYVRELFEILGARDPYQVQGEMVSAVERAVDGLDEAALKRPEAEGKWSIAQVIQHLADTELVMGFRYRMALAHDEPDLQAWDQDRWARALRYDALSPNDSLEQLRALRRANLRLLRSLDGAQLDRGGVHSERGRETVRQMVRMTAGHDLRHLRQIARIKQGTEGRRDAGT